MGQLDGRTALVTGGTTGIGLATARRFAAEGAYVFVTGRRKGPLDEAVSSIGANATGIVSDVGNLDDLDRVMRTIEERGAGLDVVFANAGGGEFRPLDSITVEHVANTFDTNVYGTIFTVQKALPLLNEGASVVLTGSTAAVSGIPAFGVYAASKAAIRSFGRTWAVELMDRKIRVNTLVPGSTETPGLAGLAPSAAESSALLETIASTVPMGRLAHPDEIANAALFLASDQSSFMTGSEMFVDGGETQL